MAIANFIYYIMEYTPSSLADVSEKLSKNGYGGWCV
jgi:hypothetical protein